MGYNISVTAIERVAPQLVALAAAKDNVVFIVNQPKLFLYQLREGLKSAEMANDPIYGSLKSRFRLKLQNDRVIAVYKTDIEVEIKSIASITLPNFSSMLEVMQQVIEHKDMHSIYFPDAIYPSSTLDTWAKNTGHTIEVEDRGVTIRNEL